MYEVNDWGSHPDADNDDLWDTHEFSTVEEARAFFAKRCKKVKDGCVELKGPDVHEIHDTGKRDTAEDSGVWELEMANEAGMLHGIDAYNEVMGY